jgi:hypothetical protein
MRIACFALFAAACSDYDLQPRQEDEELPLDTATDPDPETDVQQDATVQEWTVPDQIDVLVFGDTSSSMEPELVTMGANVRTFVERLAMHQPDWQLIAVTGPDGCANNGILTPNTPDYEALFAQGILMPGGDLVDEWGLNNAMAGVQNSAPGLCNEGFVRPTAALHVVIVSDEDDNSPGWQEGGDYWKPYIDTIRELKGDASLVKFSAVGGPVPGACDGAEPANGYWEAVDATEGEFISICTDWAPELDVIADVSFVQDVFTLDYAPVVETLRVWVNDVERPAGWAFVETGNLIDFDDEPPVAGDDVRVEYETWGNP